MTTDCVGGVWTYSVTLCRALAEHGVHVTLAVTGGEMSDSQRAEAAALGNVEVHHRPYRCEWMEDPWQDVMRAGEWLLELAEDHDVDLVHLNDYTHGSLETGDLPRLVVAHSDVYSWHRAVLGVEPDFDIWSTYWHFVNSGLQAASAVVAPTEAVMEGLREDYHIDVLDEFFDKPRVVIVNAAEPPAEAPAPNRDPFILCAGRVWDEAKNVKTLAAAAKDVAWPVKVAGDATHPNGGTTAFENVEVLGPLPRERLMELMSRAAIYALPAKYEPFGLSAAEAALRGCALVLGDIPSLREVWGEAAIFVPPDDALALARVINDLIENPAIRREMADRAQVRSRLFTPQRQAQQYMELYRKLAPVSSEHH